MSPKSSSPKRSIILVSTLDGFIGRNTSDPVDWGSKEDKLHLRKSLDESDLCIIGRNSYEVSESILKNRKVVVMTSKVSNLIQQNENLWFWNPESGECELEKEFWVQRVAVLGGSGVIQYYLQRDAIHEIYLTVEPLVFGSGVRWIDSDSLDPLTFTLIQCRVLNEQGTILLKYLRTGS